MRVIAGSARGRKLKTLEGKDVRPTTDKVKEAIFSSIQFELPNAIVLDLFAGSGQMGIEAISRGAKQAVFIDRSARSLQVVHENLITLGMERQAQLHQMEATSFLQGTEKRFHIAILDPPYRMQILEQVLPLLAPHMEEDAIVVCEHEENLALPERVEKLVRFKEKKYGSIAVTMYQCKRSET